MTTLQTLTIVLTASVLFACGGQEQTEIIVKQNPGYIILAIANQAHLRRKRMQKSFIPTAQQYGVLPTFFFAYAILIKRRATGF